MTQSTAILAVYPPWEVRTDIWRSIGTNYSWQATQRHQTEPSNTLRWYRVEVFTTHVSHP